MPIPNFQAFCNELCSIAGFPAPCVQRDSNGREALSVRLRGIYFTALEAGSPGAPAAILVAEAGAMPQHLELSGWLALMDANLLMMDVHAPRFSRHPVSGEVILQSFWLLGEMSPADAYNRACEMAELALRWREDPLLGGETGFPIESAGEKSSASLAELEVIYASAVRFSLFHQEVRDALGQPPEPSRQDAGDCTFPIHLRALDVDVSVGHFPSRRPGVIFAAVRFGMPAAHAVLDRVTALMSANFASMADRHGATFCRDPWSGEMLLMYAYPLLGAQASGFLIKLAGLAELGRLWKLHAADEADQAGGRISSLGDLA